jgi:structural maintenance of chromosome 2
MEIDIQAAEVAIQNALAQIDKLQKDVGKIQDKLADVAVCRIYTASIIFELNTFVQAKHAKAEARLQEERATLTQFDNELKELDDTIKVQKKGISDAELNAKRLEHEINALEKDKITQVGNMANLEKQYDWIREECQ